jgi:hypothetical protein
VLEGAHLADELDDVPTDRGGHDLGGLDDAVRVDEEAPTDVHAPLFVVTLRIAGQCVPWRRKAGVGKPPFTILLSSSSCHTLCTKWLFVLTASTLNPSSSSALFLAATAANSVGQTKVKVARVEASITHLPR